MHDQTIIISDDLYFDAKKGDADAVAKLWDVCEPFVVDGLRHHPVRTAPTFGASDVAQEAARLFLDALRSDECPSPTSLLQYLAHRLPYRLQSYVRAERRRLGRQLIPNESAIERVLSRRRPNAYAGGPPGRRIARALEQLSPRQRAVIAGLYFREVNIQTLSDELGISYKAVSAVHGRALKVLREALTTAPEAGAADDPES